MIGGVNSGEECVAFCDNLDSHLTPDFLGLLRAVGCFRFLYLPNCSTEVQAVDAGLGSNTKYLVGKEFEQWLEIGDNLDRWENGTLSASDKRIIIIRFVGAAWKKFFNDDRYNPIRYFVKTGSLLTLDGSDAYKVCIKGLPNYSHQWLDLCHKQLQHQHLLMLKVVMRKQKTCRRTLMR